MSGSKLLAQIRQIAEKAGFVSLAVAIYDYETELHFSYQGDRFFHAASTMKVAVLLALFKAAQEGTIRMDDKLHVRNRFRSIADGCLFRIDASRDGDADIYRSLGRALKISELARVMIVRSSNLATNILIEYIGVDLVRRVLDDAGIDGIKVQRGVEDEVAFRQGLNNEVSADGLVNLFRLACHGEFLNEASRKGIVDVLLGQEYNSMIPAGLPNGSKVAHKTGEISTVCHDGGIVFLPDRKPYVLVVLTECKPATEQRHRSVAAISTVVNDYVTGDEHREARS